MTNFTTIAQIESAETKSLIEFFNANTKGTPVKKFADRQTALRRCTALLEELNAATPAPASDKEFQEAAQNLANGDIEETPGAPETVEQAENEKKFVWPFEVEEKRKNGDKRQGDRRDPTVEIPVEVKKAAITASAAAMLRKLISMKQETTEAWVPASEVMVNTKQKQAFKSLVISGLAEHNGSEGELSAVTLTDKGVEAFNSLPIGFGTPEDIAPRTLSNASNAAGVAASWSDPAVHAARLTRDGVTVTVDGKTTTHKSTRDAFRYYRLMDSKHIRFRGILKAAKVATYEEGKKSYEFKIVGITKDTKIDEYVKFNK